MPLAPLALLIMLAGIARAERMRVLVIGISDGQMLVVRDWENQEHRVRLAGVDAPRDGSALANASRTRLADLMHGASITIDYDHPDNSGVMLAKAFIDGRDAALDQIRAGMARYRRSDAVSLSAEDRKLYEAAEDAAHRERIGIWKDSSAGASSAPGAQR
jgi:endonuclease YncB( thermonuclease family)